MAQGRDDRRLRLRESIDMGVKASLRSRICEAAPLHPRSRKRQRLRMSKRTVILTAIWTIAFLLALSLDYPIAHWVHTSGWGRQVEGKWWAQIIKAPGDFRYAVIVPFLLLLTRQIRIKQAIFIVLAMAVSGTNSLVKWIAGRTRPYKLPVTTELRPFELHPFWHGFGGLFNQKDLCFPSGHECTAGALAVAILLVCPRGGWIFLTLAVLVGIERPAENAHYASDVVAGAGFAILGTLLLYKVLAGWLEPAQIQSPS
jgi:membrane-associated phospholipid phosphatase